MADSQYDVVVIGGGPGGYVAAARAARHGRRTALVEADQLGGTCINIGCMPTRALFEAAHRAELVRGAAAFGVRGFDRAAISVDWSAAQERVQQLVQRMRDGVQRVLARAEVELVAGSALLRTPELVEVTVAGGSRRELRADRIVIATGALPDPAPVQPAAQRLRWLSDLYRAPALPTSVAVFGSGPVAVELALLFGMLGSRAELIAPDPLLLPGFDGDLSAYALRRLQRAGAVVHLGRGIGGMHGDAIELDDGTLVRVQHLLHAGRRLPRRESWAGLELAERDGYLKVDRFGRTSKPSVYAVGDVTGGSMMASAAAAQAHAAVDHILGRTTSVDLDRQPIAVYLNPELATVGASEELLRKRGIAFEVSRFPLAANSKAQIADEVEGFVKVLSDAEQGEVLGVHIVAANATDLISEAALAIRFGLTADEVAAVVHPHPAFSESVVDAARG